MSNKEKPVVNILNFGDRLAQKDIIDHRSTLCAFIMLLLSLWLALPLSAYAVTASDAPFTNSDDKSHLATYEASSESTLSLPTEAKFLPVHQAFQHLMSFDAAKNEITLHWKIAEGYYLYKSDLNFLSMTIAIYSQRLPSLYQHPPSKMTLTLGKQPYLSMTSQW